MLEQALSRQPQHKPPHQLKMFSLKKTSVVVSNKKETELYNKPMTISAPPPSTMGGGFFFPMPTGVEKGDIVYWDPTAGAASTGAWIKLDAPVKSATTTEPESLTHNGQSLFWAKGLPRGTAKGQMLYWDPEAEEEGGAWVVLNAPTEQGSIMYWDGEVWQFIQPPSSSTLHVLTVQDSNLSWTATEDCP